MISIVKDKLNFIGFFGLIPKTGSYGERLKFVLACELNANVLTFCDHVSYWECKTMR